MVAVWGINRAVGCIGFTGGRQVRCGCNSPLIAGLYVACPPWALAGCCLYSFIFIEDMIQMNWTKSSRHHILLK